MQALPAGSMAAVHLGATELQSRLLPGVEIAASNAPGLCTISGPADRLAAMLEQLRQAGIETRPLHTSHAFHSAMMEPVLAPFTRLLEGITLAAPSIPYVSNVTGTWITARQTMSPAYYAEHLRNSVSFEAGVRTLAADPTLMLLEAGPGNVLTTLARLTIGKDGPLRVLQSTARPQDERSDAIILRETAAKLWVAGVPLDFTNLHARRAPRRIPLPTYPFERKRFWVDAAPASTTAAPQPRSERLEDWTFAPVWVRDETPPDESPQLTGTWLVLGDSGPLSRAVLQRFKAAGAAPVLLERDSSNDLAATVERLQEEGSTIAGAIHLWAITADNASGPEQAYSTLVALGGALGTRVQSPVRIIHASVGAASILNEPQSTPAAALASGPLLVLPEEFPNLRMTGVDLEDGSSSAVEVLLAEAARADRVPQSAWRGGRRWLNRYERITLAPAATERLPLKERGVYLITGALGGIGLTLARWLATRYQARLLLTSRSGRVTAEVSDALQAIEAAGGEAIVAAADAADEAAMSAAVEAARTRWSRIDGVIHAAGVSGSGSLAALQTIEDARVTFQAKVTGLEVLVKLLGSAPLDFVALMSSINSVIGAAGTCDYAAANAVLDAFASGTAKPAAWRHVVSINWGAWRDVGMAANLVVPEARRAQWRAMLATAIPPAIGAEAFAMVLASRRSRVVVASYDVMEVIRAKTAVPTLPGAAPSTSEPQKATPSGDAQTRPDLSSEYDAPGSDLEKRLAAIWSELLGVQPIGRQDDFFELGGHSLLATRVLARVHESFGVRLELRDVFDAPTVGRMAERIDRGATIAVAASEEREEIEF